MTQDTPMTTESEGLLPVEQADRDAAALLFDRTSSQSWNSATMSHSAAARHMLDGKGDGSPYVQAFARHRLRTRPAIDLEALERVRDTLGKEAKDWRHNGYSRLLLAELHDTLAVAFVRGVLGEGKDG